MIFPFLAGVAVGLLIAGLVAINVKHYYLNPMTPEERQALDDEMRIW